MYMEDKIKELNEKIGAILSEYNCTLQIGHTIQIVPNKMDEETIVTPEVTETAPEVVEEVVAEEVA